MPEKDKNEVHFEVDSRVLLQLGEKLITNKSIALAELVKNSYDADATYVRVYLENVKGLNGTIIVEDNGHGMSLPAFKKTWMRIATIDKEENPVSIKYKRKKSGEKGIGRLACRRLSKKLTLKSVAFNTETKKMEELTATFNWKEFKAGSDLDKIPIEYSVKEVNSKAATGTELILENLWDAWDVYDVKDAQNQLFDLISPITFKEAEEKENAPIEYDPGFTIDFDCSDFPTKEMIFDKSLMKHAWAQIDAYVDDKGYAHYTIRTTNKIINDIDKNHNREENFKHLRNTQLKIYVFSYLSKLFSRKTWSLSKAQKVGHEHGGIKVYADKFRVFGYGCKGDDWLDLNLDRSRSRASVNHEVLKYSKHRPGLDLFRNSNLFGHVVFKRNDNQKLDITANRERLTESPALEELKKFCRLGVDFATAIYNREKVLKKEIDAKIKANKEAALRKQEEERRKQAEKERKEAEERAKQAEKERKEAEEKTRAAEEERRRLEEERRAAEEEIRRLEEELKQNDSVKVRTAMSNIKRREELLKASVIDARKNEEERRKEEEEKRKKEEEERRRLEEEKEKQEEEKRNEEEEKRNEEKELFEKERALLRILASTGTMIMLYSHEVKGLIETMNDLDNVLSKTIEKMPEAEKKEYAGLIEDFKTNKDMVYEFSDLITHAGGKMSRSLKKEWVILPIVERVFEPFDSFLKKSGIKYEIDISEELRSPPMYKAELFSIIFNLFSNALKALNNRNNKKIYVRGFDEDNILHLQFIDNGKGIRKEMKETIFEPFEFDGEPDIEIGEGTGLGLKIVIDIAHHYGGDAKVIDPEEGWKTCIEITLPLR